MLTDQQRGFLVHAGFCKEAQKRSPVHCLWVVLIAHIDVLPPLLYPKRAEKMRIIAFIAHSPIPVTRATAVECRWF